MAEDRRRFIEGRLEPLHSRPDSEQVNGARELLQELSLFALSRSDFFKSAVFMGGTALRVFHSLQRFSEDLDFSLVKSGRYDLGKLTQPVLRELNGWGLETEFVLRDTKDASTVEVAWLKDASLGGLLQLQSPLKRGEKIHVKLELDTNPPSGGIVKEMVGRFPVPHSVACFDLPTLFAGKLHAILCRPYVKGRDWYDLVFYLNRSVVPNLSYLSSALSQAGPFKGAIKRRVTSDWLLEKMLEKVSSLDFAKLKLDVRPFIRDVRELELWSAEFFTNELGRLGKHKTLELSR